MTPLLVASGIGLPERLHPLDLRVYPRSLTAVIGPNGGGKTSLLRALARVQGGPGVVCISEEDLDRAPSPRRRQLLSFLPAARDMAWPISARDVIALGLARPDAGRVDELLSLLELQALAHRRTDRLSTGERARVLLGRALAERAQVLLLDEPLSNLDPYWALRIVQLLREVAQSGAAVVVSVHDLGMLDQFDRALLVAHGQLQADGPPAEVLRASVFSQMFGVERVGSGWRISLGRQAGQRSSP